MLALVVALLLVASQSLYTVDQRKYAIKFQLGEIIETQDRRRPLVQGAAACRTSSSTTSDPDARQSRARPDHDVGEEAAARRLRRAVADHRRARSTTSRVQGDEEAARRRLSQTVRANLAEEFNKRDVHEAISTERDKIMTTTRQKAERRREVDRRRDRRRAAAPRRAAARRDRAGLPADGVRAPPRRQRAALARRCRIREDPRRRRPAARR